MLDFGPQCDFLNSITLIIYIKSIYQFAKNYCSSQLEYIYFHDSDTIINNNIEQLILEKVTDENTNDSFKQMCSMVGKSDNAEKADLEETLKLV